MSESGSGSGNTPSSKPQRRLASAALQRQRARLLQRLKNPQSLLAASLVELYSRCGKPSCRCRQGFKHGPAYYLSWREDGRTQMLYIPKSMLEEVRQGVGQWKTVGELGKVNVELVRLRKAKQSKKKP